MNKINFSDTNQISQLFQQAMDKAIENHRQKGESIAVSEAIAFHCVWVIGNLPIKKDLTSTPCCGCSLLKNQTL